MHTSSHIHKVDPDLRTGRTAEVSTTISSGESKQISVILAAKDVQRYRQFEAEENFQVSILDAFQRRASARLRVAVEMAL